MPSNFDFLKASWPALHDDAAEAERAVFASPRTAAFYARRTMERMVLWLYANDGDLRKPYQDSLAALIHEPTFRQILPPRLFHPIRLIHKIGNQAVHSDSPVSAREALQAVQMLHAFLGWVARIYGRPPATVGPFQDRLISRPDQTPAADLSADELRKLQEELAKKDAALAEKDASLQGTQEELDQLRKQLAELRAANEATVPEPALDEAATRDLFIDVLLKEAGWNPNGPNVAEYPVQGMPTASGDGCVDYVLWGKDGLPLGVVEAKRTKHDPKQGQRQAELYADCLERKFGQRPIIFFSNGYETWLWDDRHYPPRPVQGFYAQDELQLLVHRRKTRKALKGALIPRQTVDRYYQEEAVRRVLETFDTDNQRKALLVLATGAGKTRLSIAIVDLLMRHNWARRVLFLADRNALLTQAKRGFKQFLPNITPVDITQEREKDDSRMVFSSYPTMLNSIDDERRDGQKRFGVGHFDLIIIDEAHRSVYQKYQAIFRYFDSLLLGLTATPRSEVDRDTYGLFELEDGVPTYAYELEQAVADGFLVPFKPVNVPTRFHREGLRYDQLSEAEKNEFEESFADEETGEIPGEIDATAFNNWLFNADTVDKVLAYLMERGLKVEGGDKLGKTIIFAKNHDHAEFIAKRFDAEYPHLRGHFCRVIDNRVRFAQSLIDAFATKDKMPQIAVSVDMLDTGIDVREVVNLVFFKQVRSKTKFWQMIGRGTRLCENLFGPGQDKQFFYIFDLCENFEFFGQNPDGIDAPAQDGIKQRIFKKRLTLAEYLQRPEMAKPDLQGLRKTLLDIMHKDVTLANVQNFIVRPHRRSVEKFAKRDAWDSLQPTDYLEINDHLTALPYPDDDDEFSRRFDVLVVGLQVAILEGSRQQRRYVNRLREIAAGLEEKKAIPAVGQQMELILEMQADGYWQNVTLPMLESARERLRKLVQFLDWEKKRENVYTDFEDTLEEAREIEGFLTPDASLRNYRLKVERFVREHQNHITIQRLKLNQPIGAADMEALEEILFSDQGPGSKDEFVAAYGTATPLGKLVREIVGLDRNAAKEAFADFLAPGLLNADQITFVNRIIDHLVQNGMMEPAALFEPPFTDQHDEGVLGILPHRADAVLKVIETINANAMVA